MRADTATEGTCVKAMTMDLRIIGGGGHARVVAEAAKLQQWVTRFVVRDGALPADAVMEGVLLQQLMDHTCTASFICGIGSVGPQSERYLVLQKYARARFASVCHPSATIATSARIGLGVFVAQGAQISTDAQIDDHALINTGAIIDHGAYIAPGAHIAPGATLSGDVRCGAFAHIGAGAVVMQGVHLAAGVVIGAGALVTKSIDKEYSIWVGSPARFLRSYQWCI